MRAASASRALAFLAPVAFCTTACSAAPAPPPVVDVPAAPAHSAAEPPASAAAAEKARIIGDPRGPSETDAGKDVWWSPSRPPAKPPPQPSQPPPSGGLDQDGDGTADDVDLCPTLPEDLDGFEDQDGCPELDNDKDGIADVQDKCPNDPETMNGFQDQDGCPDVKKK